MILICGIPSEPPLALAVAAARRARIPYRLLNQRRLDDAQLHLELDLAGSPTGWLKLGTRRYPLGSFVGIYSRMMDVAHLPASKSPGEAEARERLERHRTLCLALETWFGISPARVVNRSRPSASNLSKPLQSQEILACGLRVPPTLITSSPDEVRAFLAQHGSLIYKSISGVRSIVRRLSAASTLELERVRLLVTQFQAFIPGTNIRVHVIGERLFATEIVSDAVDYRYAGQEGLTTVLQAIELPPAVEVACFALSRRLQLPFCGIDLKRTPAGEFYCFEVNPSPAYSYYEQRSRQPMAQTLVEYLAGRQGGV